jgi:hypothetical protein
LNFPVIQFNILLVPSSFSELKTKICEGLGHGSSGRAPA